MKKLFKGRKKQKSTAVVNYLLDEGPTFRPTATASTSRLVDIKKRPTASPPLLVMPKPRYALPPARAVLRNYDHDKTEVEPEVKGPLTPPLARIHRKKVSPLPTTMTVIPDGKMGSADTAAALHSSTGGSDASSGQVYESAVESPATDEPAQLVEMLHVADPSFADTASMRPPSSGPSSSTATPFHTTQKRQDPAVNTPKTSLDLEALRQQVDQIQRQREIERAEWIKREQEHRTREQLMIEKITQTQDQLLLALEQRGLVGPPPPPSDEASSETHLSSDVSDSYPRRRPSPPLAKPQPRSSRSSSRASLYRYDDRDRALDEASRRRSHCSRRSLSSSSSSSSSLRTRARSGSMDRYDNGWKEEIRPQRAAARHAPPEPIYHRYHGYYPPPPPPLMYFEDDPWLTDRSNGRPSWSDYGQRPSTIYPLEDTRPRSIRHGGRPTFSRRPSYPLGYV
ncbi:hypothetical protein DFQ28_003327 [Apophysomyces sp. BC1034]|nr:hypothetical protein DFQ30_004913 [Apophysomyces sp. BC1015]KAG0177031.1 hypothetical protein DFQ29_005338 [Apophysomyces sp. BC1021]KAG0189513.1 hypothetical protein DFQ28_003327 [Apophysomyces sp. BC1034]